MEIDPIENDPLIAPLIAEAEKLANIELEEQKVEINRGFCHLFWKTKKRILKEQFGIEWKSPAEMNKGLRFD